MRFSSWLLKGYWYLRIFSNDQSSYLIVSKKIGFLMILLDCDWPARQLKYDVKSPVREEGGGKIKMIGSLKSYDPTIKVFSFFVYRLI